MAKEEMVVLKDAALKNNCPICFNQDMSLVFYQKHRKSIFYKQITGEVKTELLCNTCNSIVYPVKWTDDIERSVDYYQKLVQPDRRAIRFTLLFYSLLILMVAAIAVLVYFYLEGAITI